MQNIQEEMDKVKQALAPQPEQTTFSDHEKDVMSALVSGAGGLDHHVRVQEDSLQQGLGEGGQLGDQRRQSQVDPQAIVWKLADPKNNSES